MCELFLKTWERVACAWSTGVVPATWEVFVCRAVVGPGGTVEPYASLSPERRDAAAAAVEGFMQELEGWSMELQRHMPEDWNECADLLVQCLTGDRSEQFSSDKFVV